MARSSLARRSTRLVDGPQVATTEAHEQRRPPLPSFSCLRNPLLARHLRLGCKHIYFGLALLSNTILMTLTPFYESLGWRVASALLDCAFTLSLRSSTTPSRRSRLRADGRRRFSPFRSFYSTLSLVWMDTIRLIPSFNTSSRPSSELDDRSGRNAGRGHLPRSASLNLPRSLRAPSPAEFKGQSSGRHSETLRFVSCVARSQGGYVHSDSKADVLRSGLRH